MTALTKPRMTVDEFLAWFAESMVTEIKESFGTSPPGRIYIKDGGQIHIASRPGYPPNIDFSTLLNSIHQEPTGEMERTIYADAEYAQELEDGTSEIAARPFMRPVFDQAGQRIEAEAAARLNLE